MRGCLAVAVAWIVFAVPAASAATWRSLEMPQTWGVVSLTASATVPGLAWTPSEQEPLVTHDGGASWAPSAPTPFGVRDVPIQDALPSRWWLAGGQVLERSDDGGTSWQAVPGLAEALETTGPGTRGAGADQLLADPARSGVLYVIADVGVTDEYAQTVYASHDGGATWSHWPYMEHHYSRGDRGFVATWSALPGRDALLLVRSGALESDVVQEVSVVGPAGTDHLQFGTGTRGPGDEGSGTIVGLTLTGRAALDVSGRRVLLESKRGWQLSTDAGAHFHVLQPAIPARRVPPVFDPSHPGRIFALRNGRLFRSDDDGRSWQGRAAGLNSVQGLSVDAGGLIYAYGPSGLASSQDAGATFAPLRALSSPVAINALRDDGHGGLLAATELGLWRIGADELWSPLEHALFPVPAVGAAPLGRTTGVLVVRSAVVEGRERSTAPGPSFEVLPERGGPRVPGVSPRLRLLGGINGRAIASDADARLVEVGADWTATGGRAWHVAPASATSSSPRSTSDVMYSVRDLAGRRSLWSRSGQRPWKRVARLAGRSCGAVASSTRHVFVACADRLVRSDDGGRTLHRVSVPSAMTNMLSMAVDSRRPDRIALLFVDLRGCGNNSRGVTLTSTDAGSKWQSTVDACGGISWFDSLAIAPNGDLLRWSHGSPRLGLQVLDSWH
jgi:hypothetical protein